MAGGGTEVARAYVTIIPKSDGTSNKVIKSIVDPFSSSGNDAGANAGKAFHASFGSAVGTAGKVAGAALVAGMGAATLAIGAFAKSSVEAGRQFDASMSQVAATMGKSVDEIGELRDFAQEMGSKTAFSASESADALNYMALAGYDAQTSMKMLPNVLNLAAAGGIDLAYASDMVTDAQSALGLSLDETTQLVDKMAAASSKTNTSVQQLGEAFLTVGGTAKTMSGGTTEAAQALGLLADNGIKGSEGGTALRNILLGISSDKFDKTFGALGVAAYDAEGNMRSLKDIFADMNVAMQDMTVEEKTEAISSAFNKVDLKSVNALLGTNAERWDEVAAAIDGSAGAAERMAATQLDNLEGDITIFNSALEGSKIALSDAVTPALREFVQFATEGLGRVTEILKSEEFKSFADGFARGVTDAAGDLSAALFGVEEEFDEFGTLIREKQAGLFDGFLDGLDTEGLSQALQGVANAVAAAFGEGGEAAQAKDFGSALASGLNAAIPVIEAVTPIIGAAAGAVKFLSDNASTVLPVIAGVAGAFMVMQGASAVAGAVTAIGGALSAIGVGGAAAGGGLAATAGGETAAGAAASSAGPRLLQVGAAVLMIGAGVALAAAGMALLAQSAIAVSESGAGAGAAMALMVVGVAGLAVVFAAIGPALDAAVPGMLAFGAAVLMVGGGVALASLGMTMLAGVLPQIAAYGASGAAAIMALGAGMTVMGAGALVAGAGLVVLGAGLTVAAAGLLVATPAMLAASAGAAPLGAALGLVAGAVLDVGKGAADMGWGLQAAADAMPAIADNALGAGIGIGTLADAMARASGNLTTGSSAMSAAGSGAQALASGVTAARASATLAAAAFLAMGAAGVQSMRQVSSEAAAAGSSVRSSLSGLSFDARVNFSLGAMPHFRIDGEFDTETKAVPRISVEWYKSGGIFAANSPQVIGVGDAREPEVVQPLSHLRAMLDLDAEGRGGDTYIVRNLTFDSSGAAGRAFEEAFRYAGIREAANG